MPLAEASVCRRYLQTLFVLFLLGLGLLRAQSPVAYWTFDQTDPRQNLMGLGNNIRYGPAILGDFVSAWQGVRGNYLNLSAGIANMGLADTSDNNLHRFDHAFSYETCFRADRQFSSGYLFDWWGSKFQFFMSDRVVYVQFGQPNGQVRQFDVPLYGVGRADPHYWQDGNWHHLLLTFDAAIGEVKLYLDGVCPPGFSINYGPLGPLPNGSYLYINNSNAANQPDLSVDEIAIYDAVVWARWISCIWRA